MLLCEISSAVAIHHFKSLCSDLTVELYRINSSLEDMIDNGNGKFVGRHFASRTSKWFSSNFPAILTASRQLRSESKAFKAISEIKVSAFTADSGKTEITRQQAFNSMLQNIEAALSSIEGSAMARKLQSAYDKCAATVERGKKQAAEAAEPTSVETPTTPSIRGEQSKTAELAINDIISKMPKAKQHLARQAVSRADNKFQALRMFMEQPV